MTVKAYTYSLIGFAFAIASLFAIANYSVDPYMLFHTQRTSGWNEITPTIANRSFLYKPYQVSAIRPKTLIVGNSRPEMGINPNSECWPKQTQPVYNLTFPGLDTYGQVRSLFHAVASSDVNQILLGVDFADFLSNKEQLENIEWEDPDSIFFERLSVNNQLKPNKKQWQRKFIDYTTSIFSLNTLQDSVVTVLSQPHSNSVTRTTLGFNPAKDYHQIVQREGAWVLFEQKTSELRKRFEQKNLSILNKDSWSLELESIKRAIQIAQDKDIKLVLFINPYHSSYLDIIHESGYWNEFEQFKKALVQVVEDHGKGKVPLWDFSLYSSYTMEPTPAENVASKDLNWFWEPAHYKSSLGEIVLSEMLGRDCADHETAVGLQLRSNNIETHLATQNREANYRNYKN